MELTIPFCKVEIVSDFDEVALRRAHRDPRRAASAAETALIRPVNEESLSVEA